MWIFDIRVWTWDIGKRGNYQSCDRVVTEFVMPISHCANQPQYPPPFWVCCRLEPWLGPWPRHDLELDLDLGLDNMIFLVARCTDMKKERKRNLIPAKVGINSIFLVGGASILYFILIGLQVHLNNHKTDWLCRISPIPPNPRTQFFWENQCFFILRGPKNLFWT